MDEDPKERGRAYARRLAEALETSSGPVELPGPDGRPMRVRREADGTLITESARDGSTITRVWPSADQRPAEYPAGLPFLPHTTTCTSVNDGPNHLRMAQWWSVFDGESAFARLVAETLGEGWEEHAVPAQDTPGTRRQFVRGHAKRVIGRTRAKDRDFLMWMEADLADGETS